MAEQHDARRIGVDALKALAHPLRVRLYSELSSQGSATASALAARLGESSGATSYHLRQLEKHGFVREDPDRGNARDRWWERVPGPIEIDDATFSDSAAARDAGDLVETEFVRLENERFAQYWRQRTTAGESFTRAAQVSSAHLDLTAEELAAFGDEVHAVIARYRGRAGGDAERRRIEVVFRAFPIIGPAESGGAS